MPSFEPASTFTGTGETADVCAISDVALDLVIETLMSTDDAHQRSLIVHNLVQEIMAVVSWLGAEDGVDAELISLGRVLVAACEHRQRMRELRAPGPG
ncbi:MAG TPA: hypothetical protein VGC37_14720 [Friedmanniella sp.]